MSTNKRIKFAASVLVLSIALSACGTKNNAPDTPTATSTPSPTATEPVPSGSATPEESTQETGERIVSEYRAMTLASKPANELYAGLKQAIEQDSLEPAQADELIRALEAFYNKDLPKAEKSFEDAKVQQALSKLDWPLTEEAIAGLKDDDVRQLVENTIAGGYKIDTAEGYYFPIVDYGKLTAFGDKVSVAMKAYLELMEKESDAPSAKDAGLVISWDELATRVLASESYIVTFPDTPERKQAEDYYVRYLSFYFIGLNNTPIFDYETFAVLPELKSEYKRMAASHAGTIAGQYAKEFLDILAESKDQVFIKGKNGEQTDVPAVKKFRDKLQDEAVSKLPTAKKQ